MDSISSEQYFSKQKKTLREKYLNSLAVAVDQNWTNKNLVLDNFAAFVPSTAMIRSLARYELFKLIENIPGDVVECGVFAGHGLFSFLHAHYAIEPSNSYRKFIGFDTFDGFPKIHPEFDGATLKPNQYRFDNIELLEFCNTAHQEFWPEHQQVELKLVQGDIVETIPNYLQDNPSFLCALLYLDVDLYKPTLTALKNIMPKMQKGSVIAFDELGFEEFPGETIAFFEWAAGEKFELKKLPFSKITYITL
jgi:hypothetical protein